VTEEVEGPAAPQISRPRARFAPAWRVSQAQLVIGCTVSLYLLPALWDVLSNPRRPYGYLAPDAFYYFTIGTNWVEYGTPSFDQVHPTNGFHPLWQWIVTLLYAGLAGLGVSRLALVPVAVVVCLFAISVALILLGRIQVKEGRISPWFALLPVGAWPLLISPFWWSSRGEMSASDMTPLFGTLWNLANGLESALLLLVFAVVAWLYVERPAHDTPGALVFGLALGALSLARLDHAVFALSLAALPLGYRLIRGDRPGSRLAAYSFLAWLAIMLAYLMYNRALVGRFMPVSGAVKSTFPHPTSGNLDWVLAFGTLGAARQMYALGRIGSIIFPALLALLYFPFALQFRTTLGPPSVRLRPGHGRFSELMLLTASGCLGLTAYDVLFVVDYHIGEWYAPISLLFASLFAVQVAAQLANRWRPACGRYFGWAVLVVLCAVQVACFSGLHRLLTWGSGYATFCLEQAPKVIAHYAGSPPRLLSRDDGVVAFGTGFPTTSGTRLALDPEAADATNNGGFQELLDRRGIDRITAFYYRHAKGFNVGERSAKVQEFAAAIVSAPASHTFEVEYVDDDFGIVRVRRPSTD
jgi:hypothetical protein